MIFVFNNNRPCWRDGGPRAVTIYGIYLWKGLFVQPYLRWSPTVASTYDGDAKLKAAGGGSYEHKRRDLVPFLDVNVGWTFGR